MADTALIWACSKHEIFKEIKAENGRFKRKWNKSENFSEMGKGTFSGRGVNIACMYTAAHNMYACHALTL